MGKRIAIITARGGSKRVPRKNIREFCGKPIIAYSIKAALDAGIFDEVMVSTDDEEIAGISKKLGAGVPFLRSAATSGDHSTTAEVLLEVVGDYKKTGREFDELCCIYPTAPFVTGEKLKKGMELLKEADSVIPVVKFSFPPQRCMIVGEGRLKMKWPEYMNSRSQDLEPYYHDCGQFYCARMESLIREGTLIAGNTLPLYMPELEVQDIDSLEDWEIAELKYQKMTARQEER